MTDDKEPRMERKDRAAGRPSLQSDGLPASLFGMGYFPISPPEVFNIEDDDESVKAKVAPRIAQQLEQRNDVEKGTPKLEAQIDDIQSDSGLDFESTAAEDVMSSAASEELCLKDDQLSGRKESRSQTPHQRTKSSTITLPSFGKSSGAEKRPFQEDTPEQTGVEDEAGHEQNEIKTAQPCVPKAPDATKRPAKKLKVGKTRRPPAMNAREQAARRQEKRWDKLKDHIRRQIAKHGTSLDLKEMTAPTPKNRRSSKGQQDHEQEESDSDGSFVQEGPEPIAKKVNWEQRSKEISSAVDQGGLNNRRSGSQKTDLRAAKTAFGYNKVQSIRKGSEELYQLRGMKANLKPFQLVAVSWMVERETDEAPYKGGLLADAPGFGKTVMSLATIVANPPSPEDIARGVKATLVVLPNITVLKQWKEQIEEHMEYPNNKCHIYQHSRNIMDVQNLSDMNIILTTYQEIQRGYPSAKVQDDFESQCIIYTPDGKSRVNLARYSEMFGSSVSFLFHVPWYRVIFDEVHTLKNINSQTCIAAQKLEYSICWGLSGTPLVNADKEMFPYLKLIKFADVDTEKEYCQKYLKHAEGRDRVDALVSLLTYRRTHDDAFLGKKMVKIPKSNPGVRWVTLSTEERIIYDTMTELFDVDGALPIGAQRKLRQRQAVSHFYLLESFFRKSLSPQALGLFIKKLADVENRQPAYQQIGPWSERQNDEATSGKNVSVSKSSSIFPFGRSGFGGKVHLTPLIELLVRTRLVKEAQCGLCPKSAGDFDNPRILEQCKHIFCQPCILNSFIQRHQRREDPCCPKCLTPWVGTDWMQLPTVETITKHSSQYSTTQTPKKIRRRKAMDRDPFGEAPDRRPGDDFFGIQLPFVDEEGGFWGKVVLDDMFNNGGIPTPSAKTTAVKEIVLKWMQEDPGHKGIIFTQFVTPALIIGRMLQLEGIGFLYFNGKVTAGAKAKAIEGFKKNPNVRYLVATTACGGQSLNLTCASRVIIVDPWWNKAAEEQAVGRIRRIGQAKQTHHIRILARDTVDRDIGQMQQAKSDAIERTLQDDGHETKVFSLLEIIKVLEPERWNSMVRRATREVCAEDNIVMDIPESDDEAGADEEVNENDKEVREPDRPMQDADDDILGDIDVGLDNPWVGNAGDLLASQAIEAMET